MTTVLIDIDKRILASDKQQTRIYDTGLVEYVETTKIRKINDGLIVVGCGCADELGSWIAIRIGLGNPTSNKPKRNAKIIEIQVCGDFVKATVYCSEINKWIPNKWKLVDTIIKGKIWCGSGGEYARGAYEVCGDIEQAIKAACTLDEGSGFGVDVVRF